ncbi:MAG: GntR family transcriptional regulator [Rhodobacteraceae bacterium]|nr:GntR family transcriptional regulator [Paracoccaceae bacterium]
MAAHSDAVVAEILRRVDIGTLRPGDGIDEDALARQLGVSRTPVREALLKLDAQGLVRRNPRKGASVYKPSLHAFLSILEVHARLEGQAAGLAARRLSAARGHQLQAAVAACAAHADTHGDGEPDGYYQCNLAFHRIVAEASGNDCLLELIKTNARKLMAYYRARYGFAGVIAASVADHRAIATAILDRDAARAEDLMADHVQFDQPTAMDLLTLLG